MATRKSTLGRVQNRSLQALGTSLEAALVKLRLATLTTTQGMSMLGPIHKIQALVSEPGQYWVWISLFFCSEGVYQCILTIIKRNWTGHKFRTYIIIIIIQNSLVDKHVHVPKTMECRQSYDLGGGDM